VKIAVKCLSKESKSMILDLQGKQNNNIKCENSCIYITQEYFHIVIHQSSQVSLILLN